MGRYPQYFLRCHQQSSKDFIYTFTKMQICELVLPGLSIKLVIVSTPGIHPEEAMVVQRQGKATVHCPHTHITSPPVSSYSRTVGAGLDDLMNEWKSVRHRVWLQKVFKEGWGWTGNFKKVIMGLLFSIFHRLSPLPELHNTLGVWDFVTVFCKVLKLGLAFRQCYSLLHCLQHLGFNLRNG